MKDDLLAFLFLGGVFIMPLVGPDPMMNMIMRRRGQTPPDPAEVWASQMRRAPGRITLGGYTGTESTTAGDVRGVIQGYPQGYPQSTQPTMPPPGIAPPIGTPSPYTQPSMPPPGIAPPLSNLYGDSMAYGQPEQGFGGDLVNQLAQYGQIGNRFGNLMNPNMNRLLRLLYLRRLFGF